MRHTNDLGLPDTAQLCPSFSVVMENLACANASLSLSDEVRICDLALSAEAVAGTVRSLWEGGMRPTEICALLSEEVHFSHTPLHESAHTECMASLRFREGLRRQADMVTFADLLCRKSIDAGIPSSPTAFLPIGEKRDEVALVRNLYAEEAFDVFSQERAELRAVFAPTLSDAVELLRRGDVGYCLLPFLSENGVRFPSVEALVYSNDLKIVAVTPVFGFDGSTEMTYALLAQSFEPMDERAEDDLYLECILPPEGDGLLGALLCAAEGLGAELYRTDTVTYVADAERRTVRSLILKNHGTAITAFLWYISLFAPDITPIGLYKNLE